MKSEWSGPPRHTTVGLGCGGSAICGCAVTVWSAGAEWNRPKKFPAASGMPFSLASSNLTEKPEIPMATTKKKRATRAGQ
ncbi:MAG: hypothetical protein ACRD9Y_08105 [Blastocatellia bacterium]